MDRSITEILVHVTAPSRALDDSNYRTLAQAYIDFEPATRISFREQGPSSQAKESDHDASARQIESPNLSFRSVWGNVSPPGSRNRGPGQGILQGDGASQSWMPPPSVVGDSQPDNDISIAAYCSPARVLEHYLQRIESPSEPSRGRPRDKCPIRDPERSPSFSQQISIPRSSSPLELHHVPASQAQDILVPSSISVVAQSPIEVAGTQPLVTASYRDTARPSHKRPSGTSAGDHRVDDHGWLYLEASEVIPSSRADSEPPPVKRRRISRGEEDIQTLVRSSSDVGPGGPNRSTQVTKPMSQLGRVSDDDLEVHPPDPLVSCDNITPSSLLTPNLVKLEKDLKFSKRYGPKEELREVRPFERGYWLLDISEWEGCPKEMAWTFLKNYVINGHAGWGVWCKRDPSNKWIRAYCFGSVVGYIFLLLYTCSQRKLKYTGATWFDGNGDATIIVKPRRNDSGGSI